MLTLDFQKRLPESYRNIWPNISQSASPKFIFHEVLHKQDLFLSCSETNHPLQCISIIHQEKFSQQSNSQGLNWKGIFMKLPLDKLILAKQYYWESSNHQPTLVWCLLVKFILQDRFYSFIFAKPTVPFEISCSYYRWKSFLLGNTDLLMFEDSQGLYKPFYEPKGSQALHDNVVPPFRVDHFENKPKLEEKFVSHQSNDHFLNL